MLIVLERYVLFCIGRGTAADDTKMAAVVQRVWGGGRDWQATVREVLHLGAGIDESIRANWKKNQQLARTAGTSLHPIQFAKMFVDANFGSLIRKID